MVLFRTESSGAVAHSQWALWHRCPAGPLEAMSLEEEESCGTDARGELRLCSGRGIGSSNPPFRVRGHVDEQRLLFYKPSLLKDVLFSMLREGERGLGEGGREGG